MNKSAAHPDLAAAMLAVPVYGCASPDDLVALATISSQPLSGCGHENVYFDAVIERIEPQSLFSFHWHPYAVDPTLNYAEETPTLVTFTLHEGDEGGVVLKVVESGFDKVPPQRRLEAFRMNSRGWEAQMNNIGRYLSA